MCLKLFTSSTYLLYALLYPINRIVWYVGLIEKKLSYHSCIILNTGEEIDLTPNGCSSFTLLGMIEINPDVKISKKIAEFLNVPFQQMTIKKLFSNAIENIMEASQKGTDEEKKKQ